MGNRTGDADALRKHHLEGALTNQRGLVTHAVKSARADMLALLLDLGLDPDERDRVNARGGRVPWGEPLRQCAILSKPAMAEILLNRGANANTNVYAASSAMYEAHARQDRAMVELLERHGGFVDAGTAGYLGLAERLRRLFDDEAVEARTISLLISRVVSACPLDGKKPSEVLNEPRSDRSTHS